MRSEDQADDPLHAGRAQEGGGLLNERLGVLGAERHHVAARCARVERVRGRASTCAAVRTVSGETPPMAA